MEHNSKFFCFFFVLFLTKRMVKFFGYFFFASAGRKKKSLPRQLEQFGLRKVMESNIKHCTWPWIMLFTKTPLELPLHFCSWKFLFIFTVGYENCHSVMLLLQLWPLGPLYCIRAGKYVSENKNLLLLIPGEHKRVEWTWKVVTDLSEISSYRPLRFWLSPPKRGEKRGLF